MKRRSHFAPENLPGRNGPAPAEITGDEKEVRDGELLLVLAKRQTARGRDAGA